jgi:hypothetical protein
MNKHIQIKVSENLSSFKLNPNYAIDNYKINVPIAKFGFDINLTTILNIPQLETDYL